MRFIAPHIYLQLIHRGAQNSKYFQDTIEILAPSLSSSINAMLPSATPTMHQKFTHAHPTCTTFA